MLRSPFMTILSAVIFLAAATAFSGAYSTYRDNRRQMETLQVRSKLRARHQQQFKQQQRVVDSLDSFVAEANRLGLDPDNWETYDVHIQEVISFSEMKRIVSQCVNTSAYYFKPVSLEAKRKVRNPKKILEHADGPSLDEQLPDSDQGDIYLSLRGTFVVKQNR